MKEIILVFLGAGIGGVLRFTLGSLIYALTGRNFPYGTLVINLSGSFIMGFLYIYITHRFESLTPQLTSFILVGILGGYTTFSSFSLETLNLFQNGKFGYAIINGLLSPILGIMLAYGGVILGKRFVN